MMRKTDSGKLSTIQVSYFHAAEVLYIYKNEKDILYKDNFYMRKKFV